MKKIFIILICITAAACSRTLTYNEAIDKNQSELESDDLKSDAQFLVEAKSFSILQEELGKLATTAGYSAEVQTFAQKISEDHKKMNEEIKKLASEYKIVVPAEMSGGHQMKYDQVRNSSREEFDEIFLKTIEEMYDSSIELYESYATVATTDDFRVFAAENLGILRSNEEAADDLEDDLL